MCSVYFNMPKKAAMAEFVSDYLEPNAQNGLPENKVLVLAGGYRNGEIVTKINSSGVVNLGELFSLSTLEEADIRLRR